MVSQAREGVRDGDLQFRRQHRCGRCAVDHSAYRGQMGLAIDIPDRRQPWVFWLIAWWIFYEVPERHRKLSDSERAYILSDRDEALQERKMPWSSILGYRQAWSFYRRKIPDRSGLVVLPHLAARLFQEITTGWTSCTAPRRFPGSTRSSLCCRSSADGCRGIC